MARGTRPTGSQGRTNDAYVIPKPPSSSPCSPGSVPGRRAAPRWKAEKFPLAEPGQGDPGRGGGAGSSGPRGPRGGELGAEPRGASQGPGSGMPLTGREGHPGRYLLLDLPVLRDDPVRGGQGPSSHHAQQSGKAEKPPWARARRQLEPAADPYCRRHLAPPSRVAHTGSGSYSSPSAILGRSPLEQEEEPAGCSGLPTVPFSSAWGYWSRYASELETAFSYPVGYVISKRGNQRGDSDSRLGGS